MSGTVIPDPDAPPLRFGVIRAMARGWWLFGLRGLAGILFGLLAFLLPGAGLAIILAMLAAWLAVDGVFTLWQAIAGPKQRHDFWFWVDGLTSLAAAAFLLFSPGSSALVLVLVAGAWAIVSGAFRIVLAFRAGNVLLGLLGALGVLVGGWLLAAPGAGLLALIWVVAIQAVIGGALLVGLAFRLRRVNNDPTPG